MSSDFLTVKPFPHSEHEKGRSPVWSLLCLTRFPFKVKDFPHSEQEKGRSLL
ncbi:unnamed protein product [Staurois parvus]|uniref:Uncharacterized protein n=1 Tax=Staurois parvus TaxID=386267 RepID=A0ABN9DR00_9NEOB|nr:unnamed protein product [Staurois parvus]